MRLQLFWLACLGLCHHVVMTFPLPPINYTSNFQAYPVHNCPFNQSAWEYASDLLNCSKPGTSHEHLYHCLPNKNKTQLLELCYPWKRLRMSPGFCFVVADSGRITSDNCSSFVDNQCQTSYDDVSSIYKYPACLKINPKFGCYTSEPGCPDPVEPDSSEPSETTTFSSGSKTTTVNDVTTETSDTSPKNVDNQGRPIEHGNSYLIISLVVLVGSTNVMTVITPALMIYWFCCKRNWKNTRRMLHVIADSMDEGPVGLPVLPLTISPFTRKLKDIALNLTNGDFSTLKLVVQSDDILEKQALEEVKNPQDLLRILQGRSLIRRGNTQLLYGLLLEIDRKDLAKLLVEPDICQDGEEKESAEDKSHPNSQMNIENDDDDNKIIKSSHGRKTDEEKLTLKKMPDCQNPFNGKSRQGDLPESSDSGEERIALLSDSDMPKTKTTVRKGRKCPLCPLRFYTDEEMAKHITSCSKALIYCDHCDFSSLTSRNIKRHMKRKHDLVDDREQMDGGIDSEDQGNVDSDEESWLGQDPGSLVEVLPVVADEHEREDVDHEPGPSIKRSIREEAGKIVEIGRVVRKPTRPMPIHTPHRELVTATVPDKSISTDLLPDICNSKLEKYKDAQCQTDPLYYTESTVITTRLRGHQR